MTHDEFAATLAGLVSSGENERVWRDLVSALPAAIYITDASRTDHLLQRSRRYHVGLPPRARQK